MEERFVVDIASEPERVFPLVADLDHYPDWMQLVHEATPDHDGANADTTGDTAWIVTLRAKVGPFARSKRLRMVRTIHEPCTHVRFERVEHDGREHSTWVLEAKLSAADSETAGSKLDMMLSYSGNLWSGVLDTVLDAQVAKATKNLERLSAKSD